MGNTVGIAVVEPSWTDYHVAYRVGSRHPLSTGAAGKAILMGQTELTQLLKHILQQEEFAVAALESAAWQIGQRAAGGVATAA